MPADVGLVRTGAQNGWESPLAGHSNAAKVGKNFLFAEPDPQNERDFPRHFFAGRSRDRAYVYHDPSFFPMFMHDPGSSNCRVLIQRVHAIGSEIIGTAFPTDLSDSLPPSCTPLCPMLTLATSDILASPHPQHLITLRNFPRQAGPHDQTITLNWL